MMMLELCSHVFPVSTFIRVRITLSTGRRCLGTVTLVYLSGINEFFSDSRVSAFFL